MVPVKPIYLDDRASLYVVVDAIDYEWLTAYRWNVKPDTGGLLYPKRNVGRARTPFYLHIAVCTRRHGPAPVDRPICDHRDGNTLDARGSNLRWVTHAENNRNRRAWRTRLVELPEPMESDWPGW